jgi:hypothetical protein
MVVSGADTGWEVGVVEVAQIVAGVWVDAAHLVTQSGTVTAGAENVAKTTQCFVDTGMVLCQPMSSNRRLHCDSVYLTSTAFHTDVLLLVLDVCACVAAANISGILQEIPSSPFKYIPGPCQTLGLSLG